MECSTPPLQVFHQQLLHLPQPRLRRLRKGPGDFHLHRVRHRQLLLYPGFGTIHLKRLTVQSPAVRTGPPVEFLRYLMSLQSFLLDLRQESEADQAGRRQIGSGCPASCPRSVEADNADRSRRQRRRCGQSGRAPGRDRPGRAAWALDLDARNAVRAILAWKRPRRADPAGQGFSYSRLYASVSRASLYASSKASLYASSKASL